MAALAVNFSGQYSWRRVTIRFSILQVPSSLSSSSLSASRRLLRWRLTSAPQCLKSYAGFLQLLVPPISVQSFSSQFGLNDPMPIVVTAYFLAHQTLWGQKSRGYFFSCVDSQPRTPELYPDNSFYRLRLRFISAVTVRSWLYIVSLKPLFCLEVNLQRSVECTQECTSRKMQSLPTEIIVLTTRK